jgi:hypothetical protein
MSSTSSKAAHTSTVNSSPESTAIVGGVYVLTENRYSVRFDLMVPLPMLRTPGGIAAQELGIVQSRISTCPEGDYREAGKIKNRTLANLSRWPAERIERLRAVLRGDKLLPAAEAVEIVRALPHGHVLAALGTARRIAGRGAAAPGAATPPRSCATGLATPELPQGFTSSSAAPATASVAAAQAIPPGPGRPGSQ